MRIASYVQDSIVDGPGLRFALFTQGCPHKCGGCQNPDTHDPLGGREETPEEIIAQMLSNPLTDGLTLTGGEPFFQPLECAKIAAAAREAGLDVWCYTGYTFEELLKSESRDELALLKSCDVLVDGRFELEKKSLALKWRGSGNQRILDVGKSLEKGCAALYDEPGHREKYALR